jgi:transcriptional antiterminator RfaH
MLDQPGDAILQPAAELGRLEHHQCHCVPGYRWTCVRTHPQAERWAQANLERSGYRCYLPLITLHRPDRALATMVHRVTVPAFAGYLFVQHDPATSWGPIRDTPGVSAVLRCGNRIQYARAGTVEALEGALGRAGVEQRKGRQWAPGASCVVARGIFAGHPAVVLDVVAEAAFVSILFLGELREVALALDSIKARDAA